MMKIYKNYHYSLVVTLNVIMLFVNYYVPGNEGRPYELSHENLKDDEDQFRVYFDCLTYVRNASIFSTIKKLNSPIGNFTLWIKLWNPANQQNGEARLLLSLLPIPTSAEDITQNWKAGIEIVISNTASKIIYPNKKKQCYSKTTPNILSGLRWTGIWITWEKGFISVGIVGTNKPIFLKKYKDKNTILSLYPDRYVFYGLIGTGILWSTEFCEKSCEVYITYGLEFINTWQLKKNNDTYDLNFNVRTSHPVAIRLYQLPSFLYPCFTVFISDSGTFLLEYQESQKSKQRYLKSTYIDGLLDFWQWNEFSISIYGPHLRIYLNKFHESKELIYFYSKLLRKFRWFSIGSKNTISYWTLFCSPHAIDAVEEPWFPNCINKSTNIYVGHQWTSLNEKPCIPWISDEITNNEKLDEKFIEKSAIKALNKCRNPLNDPLGPYCFVLPDFSKQYCPIRPCRSLECRLAGTANDYIGTLSITRSGRVCAPWFNRYDHLKLKISNPTKRINVSILTTKSTVVFYKSTIKKKYNLNSNVEISTKLKMNKQNKLYTNSHKKSNQNKNDSILVHQPTKIHKTIKKIENKTAKINNMQKTLQTLFKPIHSVDPIYFNDLLYPEKNMQYASNYCRNPSRNIAGTWCYTTDPLVPQDLCNVKDCEKREECTFFIQGQETGRQLYILPEYRSQGMQFSLKNWEPDNPDFITFVFKADDNLNSKYVLKIGAANNEKVLLYYQSENEGLKLVKKKTLPHLIHFGKWSNFILRIPHGKIELFYERASNPLFEWEQPEQEQVFLPIYYYCNSEFGHTIGVGFDCNSRCHIENTKTDRFTRILPVSVWNLKKVSNPCKLELMIRAHGIVLIPLMLLPATSEYYGLTLGDDNFIYFLKNTHSMIQIFHKQKLDKLLYATNTWTNITIKWMNFTLSIFCNDTLVLNYEHTNPLIFYFFSLSVDAGGWATWAANCIPIDIDGEARDGGWSEWGPWICSANCNGGVGTRKRVCNLPEPNIRGESCFGPSIMTTFNTIAGGDITKDTIKIIKRRIRENYTALHVEEGNKITIYADSDLVNIIVRESPDAKMKWSQNGIYIHGESIRKKIINFNIVLKESTLKDSGIYTMTLHRINGTISTLKIVSLAVIPSNPSIIIRETLPLIITCHCSILGYIYTNLNIQWNRNNNIWKNYGTILPTVIRREYGCYDEVSHTKYNHNKRQCNWIRFLRIVKTYNDQVNLVGTKVKGEPIFEVVKNVQRNAELVAWFLPAHEENFVFISREMCSRSAIYRCTIDSILDDSPLDLSMTLLSQHSNVSGLLGRRNSYCEVDEYESTSEESSSSGLSLAGDHLDCSILTSIKRGERLLLPCEVCGKSFDRPSLLKRHMRTHTGEKPHICMVCNKGFSTSSSLNTHKRIHSGEKPHQCLVCGKKFTASSNLYYHRMTHIKEKPHKCSQCSKSFPTPGDLKSHMYVHNGLWPFRCNVCSRGFSKPTNLKNHMLLHLGRCSSKKLIKSVTDT